MMRVHLSRPEIITGAHDYAQAELAEAMRARLRGLDNTAELRQMVGFIYEHAAIDRRHLEIDLAELADRRDWYLLVNHATLSLARRALEATLAHEAHASLGSAAPRRPGDSVAGEASHGGVDALIAVSSSFAGFPSLARRLQAELGLARDALCYDLAGLGCAGPTHGLQLAHMLIQTGAARQVALVCADAMGTHGEIRVHASPPTVSQLVAHCLASDGAAALLVSAAAAHAPSISWESCRLESRLWPDSLAENDFCASADNQPMIAVGKDIRTRLVDELGPLLAELDPETALFHPGGAALMRALGSANPALVPTLELSSSVLREHGNIGAASLLFVLRRAWDAGRRLGPRLRLIALGPGIVSTKLCCDAVT